MTKIIEFFKFLNFFGESKKEEKDDFADFFLRASSKEKKKLFKRVIHKANQDQKKYLEKYEQMKKRGL